jgi:hypothetical protein
LFESFGVNLTDDRDREVKAIVRRRLHANLRKVLR